MRKPKKRLLSCASNGPISETPEICRTETDCNPQHHAITPKKDAVAFDYKPDGTGRDLYVIRLFGLKRNYKS